MKLALVYHQFAPRGGLEAYLMEFARRLRAAGHNIELVTSRADDEARSLAGRVHWIPSFPTGAGALWRFARDSAAIVASLKVDAVLGFGRTWRQDVHRAGGGCHAGWSAGLPWWKRWRPKNRLELALERRLYTGGDTRSFVVNAAKAGAEIVSHYRVPAERIHVIHTAVDTGHFRPAADRAEQRRLLNVPEDKKVLLFVSLDHRRKGLPVLLEALAHQRDPAIELWVAGQSLAPWRSGIAAAGMNGRVRELGCVSDLRPYYRAADLFVHPTQYDACANTVLQSMSCGLPGIVSVADGAVEFITPPRGWVLENPCDSQRLGELIATALPLAAGRREAARAAMLPLTWDAHLAGWMNVVAAL